MAYKILILGKEYDCQVITESRGRRVQYHAFGNFDGKFVEARASSLGKVLKTLEINATNVLD